MSYKDPATGQWLAGRQPLNLADHSQSGQWLSEETALEVLGLESADLPLLVSSAKLHNGALYFSVEGVNQRLEEAQRAASPNGDEDGEDPKAAADALLSEFRAQGIETLGFDGGDAA